MTARSQTDESSAQAVPGFDAASGTEVNVLHVAGWYPGPWSAIEGNFVQSHIRLFLQETRGRAIVVQVRHDPASRFKLRLLEPEEGVRGHYILTRFRPGKLTEVMGTLLLLFALLRARAWRYDALQFHVAWPLLAHVRLWHWIVRKPILISEHWSAYQLNFNLPQGSRALSALRRPFQRGFPVMAVSQALLDDIRRFSQRNDFPGHVVPNCVPMHGANAVDNPQPVLFAVNRWVDIKDPMPMLAGLAKAASDGARFKLVIGGFGDLLPSMQAFVASSALSGCTHFLGTMTKSEIAEQLRGSDGYVFSSLYETFSVACAEALGAGVPLLGPHIPAIAEYASEEDWQRVEARDANSWAQALVHFLDRMAKGAFDRPVIAQRAAARFSPESIRAAYRAVLRDSLPAITVKKGATRP